MGRFKEYDTGPGREMIVDLTSMLAEDHLCKRIEKIVGGLDVSAIESDYSDLGQNALHPKLMLSVIFYGYATGTRSGRKLEDACKEQIPFIYLSNGYGPKKTCINEFRRKYYTFFPNLFIQVLKQCQELGMGDSSFSIVDGSKLLASSSKRRTKNKAQFERWYQTLSEDITSLEQELLDSDEVKKN